jgi:hypothetical protein
MRASVILELVSSAATTSPFAIEVPQFLSEVLRIEATWLMTEVTDLSISEYQCSIVSIAICDAVDIVLGGLVSNLCVLGRSLRSHVRTFDTLPWWKLVPLELMRNSFRHCLLLNCVIEYLMHRSANPFHRKLVDFIVHEAVKTKASVLAGCLCDHSVKCIMGFCLRYSRSLMKVSPKRKDVKCTSRA